MQNLYENLAKILGKDRRVFSEGKILKNKVSELVFKLDKDLLDSLLKNKQMKEHFFIKAKNAILVFDQDKFIKFINNKEFLPDSFTTFKNRVGLTENDEYLKDSGKVVLSWGYKDCVLEGGQDKEDIKRDEIFYNEILAPDEIDRLFEPKVLTNAKKIDKSGEHKIDKITEQDNLVIKGNNLLVLHSLKKKYAGKIKLIYIDPPYNTENSGFNYNDSFNHSTWLTFMENRLKVARELLSSDGSIYVNIDYNEVHYLKVLMDEIFTRQNFQREIIWRIGWLSGYKTIADNYIRNHDTILFYSNNQDNFVFNKLYNTREDFVERFNNDDKKEIFHYFNKLKIKKDKQKSLFEFLISVGLPEKYPLEDTWNCSDYDKLNSVAIVSFSGEKVSKLLGTQEIKGQKSEKLLKRIIEVATNKGDIVLDFCAGTGTTGAVAHKLGRRYILCEQLNYIENITKERIKKVIAGEQTGISKQVKWKGGGSFVYAELKQWNEEYLAKIKGAKTVKQLMDVYKKMREEAFFRYEIDLSKFDKKDFSKLELKDQKKILMDCLDKNHLYVNYNELEDSTYKISAEDKRINKQFYGK